MKTVPVIIAGTFSKGIRMTDLGYAILQVIENATDVPTIVPVTDNKALRIFNDAENAFKYIDAIKGLNHVVLNLMDVVKILFRRDNPQQGYAWPSKFAFACTTPKTTLSPCTSCKVCRSFMRKEDEYFLRDRAIKRTLNVNITAKMLGNCWCGDETALERFSEYFKTELSGCRVVGVEFVMTTDNDSDLGVKAIMPYVIYAELVAAWQSAVKQHRYKYPFSWHCPLNTAWLVENAGAVQS